MIIPIELSFKVDKDTRLAFSTHKTIKSHDVNSVEFHIAIEGLELTNNHTAKILSIFHNSQSQVNTDCEIVDGKVIYKPDTKLISMHETVTNYVYIYQNDQSLDVCEFNYTVKLSKIDETALEVKEVYDQSYADLLANFEQALSEYKDSLPQADSVRADIDEILNQFNVDSQAKLSLINEAEESRVQSEEQRASAESNRISAESERVLAEGERENAEEQRKIDHANRSAELDSKANKKQEDWITPTLLNGATSPTSSHVGYFKDTLGFVHFKGRLSSFQSGVILILPEGYRPSVVAEFPTNRGSLTLWTNGELRAFSTSGTFQDTNLVNISFRAEG